MTENADKALHELVRILEEAVQAKADCLELEWEGGDLVAYQYLGSTGVGAASIPEEIRTAILREIIRRAKLTRNPTGTMPITLLGKEYEVFVKQYESFGEDCFTLRLNKVKARSR
jgi:hypothetical protein